MQRILVGGPIRQAPEILFEHLRGLLALEAGKSQLDFAFVDDNDNPASREMLRRFERPGSSVRILPGSPQGTVYGREADTHNWHEQLFWRVAAYRDLFLQLTVSEGYDGVFLVDSDLVVQPRTLTRLVTVGLDVVSEVFWTRWGVEREREEPQVWLGDQYKLFEGNRAEISLSAAEIDRREELFFDRLRRPGVYEVGGLGACTLFSKQAVLRGASYREVPYLPYFGEDRHFSVRAAVLGIKLHADTYYPPLHMYRPEDVQRVEAFWRGVKPREREIDAMEACATGLISWRTSHYATVTGREGSAHVVAPLAKLMESEADQAAAQTRALHALSRIHWLGGRPVLQPDGDVKVLAELVQFGREGETGYVDIVEADAVLTQAEGPWRIRGMDLAARETPSHPPVFIRKTRNNRVLLSMLVHNEAGRYLEQVLAHAARYVDGALIVDDASTDDSVAVARRVLAKLPHQIVTLASSGFHEEHRLRRIQWELALAQGYDWIVCLDADEIFEDRMITRLRELVDQDVADVVGFRLYDMWDADHYRDDTYWQAHQGFRPFLVRPVPGVPDDFRTTNQHCGRLPLAIEGARGIESDVRLKHLGWMSPADRVAKHARYMQLDPEGKAGVLAQYHSILDAEPGLTRWTI